MVSGYHHDAVRTDEKGSIVMYAEAAERMSKNNNPDDRVAWLVQIGNELVAFDRYDIP